MTTANEKQWDVFISYASEDRAVARQLGVLLDRKGLRVWRDRGALRVGDRLTPGIDAGLAGSRYGVVIVSDSFLGKPWPRQELDGLEAREESGQKIVLPVLHRITKERVARVSPMLAGRLAANTGDGLDRVVDDLLAAMDRRPVQDVPADSIGLAMSHNQTAWRGFADAWHQVANPEPLIINDPLTADVLNPYSVLILALPKDHEFVDDVELADIEAWVRSGGGLLLLGYYLADRHHGSNPSKLARRLGFAFDGDLVMPKERASYGDCQDQAFENEPELAVRYEMSDDDRQHPLGAGVDRLAFLSSCSLTDFGTAPDFKIEVAGAAVMRPNVRADENGYIRQVREYRQTGAEAVIVLAGWRLGQGKLVACGTWKIATFDSDANLTMTRNVIDWLGDRG